ncbi:MAG: polysaccharide deacetylase family protein [Mesorhizobium sp.]|uniref:polysaccharide deacetylase family protein n=1 Tax=Mesorhizobium sp. TaxID=1871066 RepID=UPI000FEA2AF1|nr:polysaccharide deacetylase family protein [Mesorhizobium sp.]RWF47558.1 MAG: polysaccharide deacetylase family protein [Mesorhizobium sp.]
MAFVSGRRLAQLFGIVALGALATGCTTAKPATDAKGGKLAYATEPKETGAGGFFSSHSFSGLAGRSVTVNSIADLRLRNHEVVLTFDDGPMPGRTENILKVLDNAGVKATFMMVGQMARSYPALVREVAAHGHTIGTHTQNHANLTHMSATGAQAQIDGGIKSVSAALVPSMHGVAPFFRFPYLASTATLRRQLAARGIVVIDADIDSKDYFPSTPDQVRKRTMAGIEQRGSGIILMHDIHPRTAQMLPHLLADLRAKGYKVVRLVPGHRGREPLVSLTTGTVTTVQQTAYAETR